jgi:hypothetical protein
MGKPQEVLEAIAPCIQTRTSLAGLLLMLRAESLQATGRLVEARQAAAEAISVASDGQRTRIRARLLSLMEET